MIQMANRTNHWTKYIIDGVDYRDICKRNNISETCFYSRVCTLGIPPEYACKIPSVKDRQPLLEIVRLMKENEAMRDEFELWHYNHKCVLEELESARQALKDHSADASKMVGQKGTTNDK